MLRQLWRRVRREKPCPLLQTVILQLSDEVLQYVFKFLDIEDLAALSLQVLSHAQRHAGSSNLSAAQADALPVSQCRRLRLLVDDAPAWEEECKHRWAPKLVPAVLLWKIELMVTIKLHILSAGGHGWRGTAGQHSTGALAWLDTCRSTLRASVPVRIDCRMSREARQVQCYIASYQ